MGEYTGRRFAAVTPSDTTNLGEPIGFFVGTAGNVAIKGANDAAATTLKNLSSGQTIPFGAAYVMATNTTATDIVAIYKR